VYGVRLAAHEQASARYYRDCIDAFNGGELSSFTERWAADIAGHHSGGPPIIGRQELAGTIADATPRAGVTVLLDRVIASREITILEARLRNPEHAPDHCPTTTTQVHFNPSGPNRSIILAFSEHLVAPKLALLTRQQNRPSQRPGTTALTVPAEGANVPIRSSGAAAPHELERVEDRPPDYRDATDAGVSRVRAAGPSLSRQPPRSRAANRREGGREGRKRSRGHGRGTRRSGRLCTSDGAGARARVHADSGGQASRSPRTSPG
jgi:hypothetical protein